MILCVNNIIAPVYGKRDHWGRLCKIMFEKRVAEKLPLGGVGVLSKSILIEDYKAKSCGARMRTYLLFEVLFFLVASLVVPHLNHFL